MGFSAVIGARTKSVSIHMREINLLHAKYRQFIDLI